MVNLTSHDSMVTDFILAMGMNPADVKRVIIDIQPGCLVTVHVQRYVDAEMFVETNLLAKVLATAQVKIYDKASD